MWCTPSSGGNVLLKGNVASTRTVCAVLRLQLKSGKVLKMVLSDYIYSRKPGSGCPTKITSHVKQIVEQRMRQDDETTATQLHELLTRNGISLCLRTILRCHEQLG